MSRDFGDKFRREASQVPSENELAAIFETEVPRAIPAGKVNQHFASLDPFIDFLNGFGFDTSIFRLDQSWQEALAGRDKTQLEIVNLILSKDPNSIAPAARALYQYLAEEDIPQKSDLIIGFGAKTIERAKTAVELHKIGLAPKILFTGGHAIWQNIEEQEAEVYKTYAIEQEIQEEDIITEPNSITIPDNVRSSLNLLDETHFKYKKLISVNSPYSQRRGFAHMQKYSPEGTIIYRVNCATREGLREDDWFTNADGVKYIVNEFGKIWIGLITNTI